MPIATGASNSNGAPSMDIANAWVPPGPEYINVPISPGCSAALPLKSNPASMMMSVALKYQLLASDEVTVGFQLNPPPQQLSTVTLAFWGVFTPVTDKLTPTPVENPEGRPTPTGDSDPLKTMPETENSITE